MCKENLNSVTKEELVYFYRCIYHYLKLRYQEPFTEVVLRTELGRSFRVHRADCYSIIQTMMKLGYLKRCGKIGFHCAYIVS